MPTAFEYDYTETLEYIERVELTQATLDELDDEDYAYYLAYGEQETVCSDC